MYRVDFSCELADGIRLRPVQESDAQALAAAFQKNQQHLAPWEPIRPEEFYTVAGQQEVIQRRWAELDAGQHFRWCWQVRTAGAKESDVIGQAGAALKVGDATVTATPIAGGDATFGKTICTSVTLNNGSKETVRFNLFDWKLQAPSGTIITTGFAGSQNMLSSGEIAPGGTASGDVCVDNKNGEAGQFIVFYESVLSFFSDRAAWINAL